MFTPLQLPTTIPTTVDDFTRALPWDWRPEIWAVSSHCRWDRSPALTSQCTQLHRGPLPSQTLYVEISLPLDFCFHFMVLACVYFSKAWNELKAVVLGRVYQQIKFVLRWVRPPRFHPAHELSLIFTFFNDWEKNQRNFFVPWNYMEFIFQCHEYSHDYALHVVFGSSCALRVKFSGCGRDHMVVCKAWRIYSLALYRKMFGSSCLRAIWGCLQAKLFVEYTSPNLEWENDDKKLRKGISDRDPPSMMLVLWTVNLELPAFYFISTINNPRKNPFPG